MSHPSQRRIGIIGGGLSGLATAAQLHLANPSLNLSLFEAASHLGGVIQTERDSGFVIDHGADMFTTRPSAAVDLCERLGIADRLMVPEEKGRGARIVHDGNLVPIPEGFVLMRATQCLPMLSTPLLSWRGKLRFLAERWIHEKGDEQDESVADFVRRRMGSEVLDRIVAPLSAGIYTADVTKLSMQATMGPIASMERKYGSLARATAARRRSGEDSIERASAGARYGQFRAFPGGMCELIGSLADSLPSETIRLGSSIDSIRRESSPSNWIVTTVDGQHHPFDHVVVAVPPRPASRLLQAIVPEAASELASIESASAAIVVLGVREADIQRDVETFGFVVPLTEGRRILAGSFASHKFAGRAPEGHVLIRVFIGGAMQPELLALSDEELVTIAREELGEIIGLVGSPVITRIVRWDHAMPQYQVGHKGRVERLEASIGQIEGLSLVTNAIHGVGIAPVIQQAGHVANRIVASFTDSSDAARRDGVQS